MKIVMFNKSDWFRLFAIAVVGGSALVAVLTSTDRARQPQPTPHDRRAVPGAIVNPGVPSTYDRNPGQYATPPSRPAAPVIPPWGSVPDILRKDGEGASQAPSDDPRTRFESTAETRLSLLRMRLEQKPNEELLRQVDEMERTIGSRTDWVEFDRRLTELERRVELLPEPKPAPPR